MKIATAFLIVSEEMASRWVLILSFIRDCANHCISLRNLGDGIDVVFFNSLKR